MTTRNPSNTPTQTKWTWFELVGLILAFGLIGWPVLNFAVGAVFPPNAQGEAAPPFSLTTTASVSNAAPGEQFNYIFAIKATRTATLGRLTTVLPDQLNYVNSFCVPPNCDRVNNSEYNVDKRTLSYSGTSTAFQSGDSVTLVLVVQLSKNATGTIKSTAQICDTSLLCATSTASNVTIGGSSAPTTAAATATPAPPTATAVPPTATDVPATATAQPTATAVPATATPAAPPTATPIAAPTPTPVKATTPPKAVGDGEAGTPSSDQATVSAATATAEPTTAEATTAAATTVAPTAAPTTGVIGGTFTASAGAAAISGNRVDLVLRGGGTEKVVASTTTDGVGKYAFLDVKPTGTGEVYYVKFTNTTGSKTLRNWSTTSFPFSGGQFAAPTADLSDITVGQPGTAGTSFTLPLTLNWTKRADGDVYSITVFRADGSGVALASGDLGSAGAYTLKNNSLPGGGYIAEINVTNANGSGVSQGQFIFKAGTVAAATTSAAVAAPTSVAAADPTATAVPTPTKVPVPAGDKGEVLPDSSGETAPATATAIPTAAPTVDTSTGVTPVTDTPDLAPIANVISLGVLAFVNGIDTGTPATLPPATNSLPQSGGELPVAGLLLAAGVLGWRRYRLVIRPRA